MQGMSERQYAAHVGLSRGAIQKAKTAERLVLFADGSIDYPGLVPAGGQTFNKIEGRISLIVLNQVGCHLNRAIEDDLQGQLVGNGAVDAKLYRIGYFRTNSSFRV